MISRILPLAFLAPSIIDASDWSTVNLADGAAPAAPWAV